MPEFRVVKKADIPHVQSKPVRPATVHLSRAGCLVCPVGLVEALGGEDCYLLIEFDEESMLMKMTRVDKLPKGISEDDLFRLNTKLLKRARRPMGTLYLRPVLKFIGNPTNGPVNFPVTIDRLNRSFSFHVPGDHDDLR